MNKSKRFLEMSSVSSEAGPIQIPMDYDGSTLDLFFRALYSGERGGIIDDTSVVLVLLRFPILPWLTIFY